MLHGLEAFDWTLASLEARLVLYRFTKNLQDNGLIDMKPFLREAFHDYKGSYDWFEDGFRKGQAGSVKLAMVARQIGRQFPERVHILIEQLQPVWPHVDDHGYWDAFLKQNATFSNVEVLRVDQNGLNIATFANAEPLANLPLKLGDGFCFRIDSSIAGYCLAMQSVNGAWFKLPLSQDQAIIPMTAGKQIVPHNADTDKPDPYSEETNKGRHKFVFAIAANPDIQSIDKKLATTTPIERKILNKLAKDIADLDGEREMFQVNVLFGN